MFNGVPDQFHQFGPSLPFPLYMSPTIPPIQNFPANCFDLYPPSISTVSTPQQHVLLELQQSCNIRKEEEEDENGTEACKGFLRPPPEGDWRPSSAKSEGSLSTRPVLVTNNVVERSMYDDLWSNDEVVALFKIRSGFENWFPDFVWDHVSRKLAELGYQRSAERCKEKFEEESRQFNDISYNKNYRFLTELNELYHVEIPQITPQKNPISQEQNDGEEKKSVSEEIVVEKAVKKRKRKKSDDEDDQLEMFMGFCGNVVKKVIEKQEEMHNKLIEDIVKKEEESIARDEAWRIQETVKIEKEIELLRAQEKANANEKEAKLIELLKKIIPFDSLEDQSLLMKMEDYLSMSKTSTLSLTNNIPNQIQEIIPLTTKISQKMESFGANDTGKRWPREEVLALINIRCKLNNNNNMNEDKDSAAAAYKGPLWERISKEMIEMGYKRSAKRCKEKWENINKYFRKTKDNKKKRAQDSRTCPYFQQLNSLYNHYHQEQGTDHLLDHSDTPENS